MEVMVKRLLLPKQHYKSAMTLIVLLTLFVVLFFDTWYHLFTLWIIMDQDMSHGLLIIAAFLILLFQQVPLEVQQNNIRSQIILSALILFLSLFWWVFRSLDIDILEQLMLPVLLALLLASVQGWKVSLQVIPTIGLLYFAIPIWSFASGAMVELSSFIVGGAVGMLSMPAFIEGNSITLPYGVVVIADGCSGSRYFVIALSLGYISVLYNRYSYRQAMIVIAIAGFVGLFTNWLRIFLLIVIGHLSEMQSPLMRDHEFFGWVLFGVLLIPLMYFSPRPNNIKQKITQGASPRLSILLLSLTLLAFGPMVFQFTKSEFGVVESIELNIDSTWQETSNATTEFPYKWPNNFHSLRQYQSDGLELIIVDYGRSNTTLKMVPYFTRLYDHQDWQRVTAKTITGQNNENYFIATYKKKGRNEFWVHGYWFDTADFKSTTYTQAKLYQIPALVTRKNRFSIISILEQCSTSRCDEQKARVTTTLEKLQQFPIGSSKT